MHLNQNAPYPSHTRSRSELHPVNYLDMIGETLTIVAGNCSDYLENVALAISTAQVPRAQWVLQH